MSLYWLILLVVWCHDSAVALGTEECYQLGFVRENLMCSTCKKVKDYGLEILSENCLKCCTQDKSSNVQKRYPLAVLEVCTCKFRAYPQIQAFIKSNRPANFPNLIIKYVRGLDPRVKLFDSQAKLKDTLSITKWNTDTVEEFFETHLEKGVTMNTAKELLNSYEQEHNDYLKLNII